MFSNLVKILLSIVIFLSIGFFSYTYLENTSNNTPAVVQKTPTTSTSIIAQKSSSTKTTSPAPVATKISTPTKTSGTLAVTTTKTETTVVAPGPLRVTQGGGVVTSPQILTKEGVFLYTNSARAQNGALPALLYNTTLEHSAQLKLADMFAKQYFEHVSPTGVGPSDLAKTVGYEYVVVGENLALGNFENNAKLVDAWMASPGHRANILNVHYQEIGIAVGKGMYEGRETWLAVQSFGKPLSSCPAITTATKITIDTNNSQIAFLKNELDIKKALLESTPPHNPSYNVVVGEYNALVPIYNTLVEATRILIAQYNAEVQAFNACIASASTH
jgi:uncharacterized protein YkwD